MTRRAGSSMGLSLAGAKSRCAAANATFSINRAKREKMSTTRSLMSAYLSYLYQCGERRVLARS
jgi:hypothetical protein